MVWCAGPREVPSAGDAAGGGVQEGERQRQQWRAQERLQQRARVATRPNRAAGWQLTPDTPTLAFRTTL